LYCEETSSGLKLHRSFELAVTSVSEISDSKSGKQPGFLLKSQEKKISVLCPTEADKDEWISKIKAYKSEYKLKTGGAHTPKHVSSSGKPSFRFSQAEETECVICGSTFGLMNRRNHCSRCSNVVCSKCIFRPEESGSPRTPEICTECTEELEVKSDGGHHRLLDMQASSRGVLLEEAEQIGFVAFAFERKMNKGELLKELIRSEVQFLKRLEAFLRGFASKYLQAIYLSSMSSASPRINPKILTGVTPKLAVLFNNLEQILTLNTELLSQLKDRLNDWSESSLVGDLFMQYASLFKLYSQYAKFHAHGALVLEKEEFENSIKEAEASERFKLLDIRVSEVMLYPLERIPTYELFLYEMSGRTKTDSPDSVFLKNALEQVRDCTFYVNEAREGQLRMQKLRELEPKFTSRVQLVHPARELLKTGNLKKISRSGTTQKYVFHLFNDLLLYSSEKVLGLSLHNSIPLDSLDFEETPAQGKIDNCFLIRTASKSFIVAADSKDERQEWLQALSVARKISLETNGMSPYISSSFLGGMRPLVKGSVSEKLSSTSSLGSLKTGRHRTATQLRRSKVITISTKDGKKYDVDLMRSPLFEFQKTVKTCSICTRDLRIMRRHHCNVCGRVICGSCSERKAMLPHSPDMAKRLCDDCFCGLSNGGHILPDTYLVRDTWKVTLEVTSLTEDEDIPSFVDSSPPRKLAPSSASR